MISCPPEPMRKLSEVMSAALGEDAAVVSLENISDGANKSSHLKAHTNDGRIFSLKISSRGVANGTTHEYLTWFAARVATITDLKAELINVPAKIPAVGRKQAVVIEWLAGAEEIRKLADVSAARSSEETAFQLGQWLWICLHFGIADRHFGNWLWSEQERVVLMIDHEDWQANLQPGHVRAVPRTILGELTQPLAAKLAEGIAAARHSLREQKKQLRKEFDRFGEAVPALFESVDEFELVEQVTGVKVNREDRPEPSAEPKAHS